METTTGRAGLRREIGLLSGGALVVANMVGSGIFTTSGLMMRDLGGIAPLMAAWALGGLFALAGALCYGELGARFPRAGGEYAFLRATLGPGLGFVSGWVSLVVGFSAPIAASAMACAAYLLPLWPGPPPPGLRLAALGVTWLTLAPETLLAAGIILGLSLLHARSLGGGLRFQNALTGLKLLLVAGFIAAGLLAPAAPAAPPAAAWAGVSPFSGPFAVALIYASFAYSGWNAVAYLGGEVKDPTRNLPRALWLGTALVTALYLLLNLVYWRALGPGGMAGVIEIGSRAAGALWGAPLGSCFGAAIALCLVSNAGAMILAGPRVYYAMAADGVFFPRFAGLSRRGGTPAPAVFLQAGLALLMVFTASFSWLLIYMGLTLSFCAALTVAGLLRLRTGEGAAGRRLAPVVFLAGNLWIMTHGVLERPGAGLASLLTILAGWGLWLAWARPRLRRGRP